jgi:hypothetical protein
MTQSTRLLRYASDMPFAIGMVLADEFGNTTRVEAVTTRVAVLTGSWGGYSHGFVRQAYPFLVQTIVEVMDEDAEMEEDLRVEALAEAAQWEDDLREQVLHRAAVEHARKNPA